MQSRLCGSPTCGQRIHSDCGGLLTLLLNIAATDAFVLCYDHPTIPGDRTTMVHLVLGIKTPLPVIHRSSTTLVCVFSCNGIITTTKTSFARVARHNFRRAQGFRMPHRLGHKLAPLGAAVLTHLEPRAYFGSSSLLVVFFSFVAVTDGEYLPLPAKNF